MNYKNLLIGLLVILVMPLISTGNNNVVLANDNTYRFMCEAHNTQGYTFTYSYWNREEGRNLVMQFCESNTADTELCVFDRCR